MTTHPRTVEDFLELRSQMQMRTAADLSAVDEPGSGTTGQAKAANPASFSPEVLPNGPKAEQYSGISGIYPAADATPLPLPASLPAPCPMESKVSKHGDADIILLNGTLDPKGAAEAKKVFAPFITGGTKLVIDMSGVDYIGSAGLRELFLAAKSIDRVGGKLAVCGLRPEVKRIFDIAGFAIPYQIVETQETAFDVLGVLV
ncbi:MAG: STAS domain-containing protein [Candidatus Methylacidiphilales bacterium]|nr:STAS domain-containing protein [Candidatus Methylacidiphilales bacterium]